METIEHHPANDANKGFFNSLGSAWIILADLMANYLVTVFWRSNYSFFELQNLEKFNAWSEKAFHIKRLL